MFTRRLIFISIVYCLLYLPTAAQARNFDISSADYTPEQIFTEDNLMLTELFLEKTNTEYILDLYYYSDEYFVPLSYLVQALDFPVNVYADKGVAQGWFINEKNTFELDIQRKNITIAGESLEYRENTVFVFDGEIYVSAKEISTWLPVGLQLDYSALKLTIHAKEELPIQAKIKRSKRRQRLIFSKNKSLASKNYPKIRTPYQAFDIPFVDASITGKYDKTDTDKDVVYNAVVRGDLAYMNAKAVISGAAKDDNKISNVRLTLERKDEDGKAFASLPIPITEFAIGDVYSPSNRLINSGSQGRGIYITNNKLNASNDFDTTDFVGDSLPGWDVELYRNNELIESITVGDDSRYEFRNIPILYGNNIFRLVFYGPEGQVQEKIEQYNIDNNVLKKGDYTYSLYADQKDREIFDVDKNPEDTKKYINNRYIIETKYGLTDYLTIGTEYLKLPPSTREQNLFEQETHNTYGALKLQGHFSMFKGSIQHAKNFNLDGNATEFGLHTRLFGQNVSTRFTHYDNLVSPINNAKANNNKYLSEIDIHGSLPVPESIPLNNLSYSINAEHEVFRLNKNTSKLQGALSADIYGVKIRNSNEYSATNLAGDTDRTLNGDISIRRRFNGYQLRIDSDYDIQPKVDFQSIEASVQKTFSKKYNARMEVKRTLTGDMKTDYQVALSRSFDHFRLSSFVTGDNDGNYSLNSSLSLSIGPNPSKNIPNIQSNNTANNGIVEATAYIDEDANGQFDEGVDTYLEGAGFKNNSRSFITKKDDKSTLITNVTPYKDEVITLDNQHISDPFLSPKVDGFTVKTRPGHITKVTFPFERTTEIDGTVYVERQRNNFAAAPFARITVFHHETSTSREIIAEFDGFFVIDKVKSGTYTLSIAEETLKKFNVVGPVEQKIIVPKNSDFISEINLMLIKTNQESTSVDSGTTDKEVSSNLNKLDSAPVNNPTSQKTSQIDTFIPVPQIRRKEESFDISAR